MHRPRAPGVEDVIAVNKAMLEDCDAASIGIYGCSAGAMLTAQTVACTLEAPIAAGSAWQDATITALRCNGTLRCR